MIRYALVCDQEHAFESWFSGSADFDTQKKRGFVTCPICGSPRVEKQLMAPAVAPSDRRASVEPPTPAPAPAESQAVALVSERDKAMREMLRALHAHVVANSDDVGRRFAEEARKIHGGEVDPRAIRGVATLEEARALHEEGIDFLPLPTPPDERN